MLNHLEGRLSTWIIWSLLHWKLVFYLFHCFYQYGLGMLLLYLVLQCYFILLKLSQFWALGADHLTSVFFYWHAYFLQCFWFVVAVVVFVFRHSLSGTKNCHIMCSVLLSSQCGVVWHMTSLVSSGLRLASASLTNSPDLYDLLSLMWI